MAKRKGGARSRLISRRFATAAEAIRFAVEDFPTIRALGAWMQVGNERFNGEDIAASNPLSRRVFSCEDGFRNIPYLRRRRLDRNDG